MIQTLTITGWTPATTNQWYGRHWRIRHRLHRVQAEIIGIEKARQGLTDAAGRRSVALAVTGWPRGGRLPDADAFDKLLLDCLVDCRLLLDDGPSGLSGRVEVSLARGEKLTVITLTDCPGYRWAEAAEAAAATAADRVLAAACRIWIDAELEVIR